MELYRHWPDFLAELLEFRALASAEQPEISAAAAAVEATPLEFFIDSLTPWGAGRWERLLGLPVQEGGVLEERRFRILSKVTEQLPFTLRRLEELLGTLCGPGAFALACVPEEYRLAVWLELTARQSFDDVRKLLERVAPANLILEVFLRYNQHRTLAAYTHGDLMRWTEEQLRNEVLSNGN